MALIEYMIQDMKEPLDYLPQAVLAGAAVGILLYLILKYSPRFALRNAGRRRQAIILSLFVTYLYVMLQEAFFSRPPGTRTSVDMEFLGTWGRSLQGNAYVIENVIMFIPWGILLSLMIKPLRKKGWLCVLTAFCASVALETAQFITQRGHCQLDDVVMNTLGGFIGWIMVKIVYLLGRQKRR